MAIAAYIICATPRSGSTLLCDLLKQSGVAGRPDSFYRQQSIANFVSRFGIAPGEGLAFERRYLAATIKAGTAGTGLFGMRVMWPSLPELMQRLTELFPEASLDAERMTAAFGPTRFIHLQRQDRIAQAVSRAKAEQSGLWHRAADGTERERVKPAEAPIYDATQIAGYVAEARQHEAAWATWFATQRIAPLEVTYETLSADPRGTSAEVLAGLGRDPGAARRVEVQTARLADAQSREWAARFARENSRAKS